MTASIDTSDTSIPERLVEGTLSWQLYYQEHIQRYEYFSSYAADRTVLDAACGVGYGSHYLATHGARDVIGIDVSVDAIREANARYTHPRVEFSVGDVQRLDLADESVDTVMSFETIEHLPNPELFVREVHRVLRPTGVFVCSTPNRRFSTQNNNPYHLSMMDLDEFSDQISAQFEITARLYQTHSAAYSRHLELVSTLEQVHKIVTFSRLLRLENAVRRLFGRQALPSAPLDIALGRAVAGDFVIAPLDVPTNTQLTYVLVAEKSAD